MSTTFQEMESNDPKKKGSHIAYPPSRSRDSHHKAPSPQKNASAIASSSRDTHRVHSGSPPLRLSSLPSDSQAVTELTHLFKLSQAYRIQDWIQCDASIA
ncbi:hypothetical protein HJC23_011848 [Cyclotella cryptica]|uniref:Uncharacterized protein n=1 Tax=Cyclotella cryptica TaxID=29204 RepID=A0ABD3QEQ7_9STRA